MIAPSHALGALEIQKKERPPALDPALVKEFVGAAHGDLDKVKSMLATTPGLLNATWDWGGGDCGGRPFVCGGDGAGAKPRQIRDRFSVADYFWHSHGLCG